LGHNSTASASPDQPGRTPDQLVNYVLGSAAQYAAGARRVPHGADRKARLEAIAAQLTQNDSDPLVHETASLLREHDDREQFLAGVDIFLADITARR
jgi:hypothetical protein